MQQGVERTATKLAIFAIAMFGFGYALVPLYDVFCEVVGINGKTGKVVEADIDRVDMDRLVTVEFDTNVNADFPGSLIHYQKDRCSSWSSNRSRVCSSKSFR